MAYDNYTIEDSLNAMSDRYKAQAMLPVSSGSESSDYSFLPQYNTGSYGTPQKQMSLKEQFGSSLTPSGGGMSSMYSSGKSYADYPTVPMPRLMPIEAPTLTAPELPTYTAPERDEKRVNALQTKAAAPGLTRLRRGLERGIQSTRSIDNPTERKFQLSGMLESYGMNLGDIISKADMTGLNEYEKEYSTQIDQAKTRFQTNVQQAMSDTSVSNQNLMTQYQQQLADRNAMFALQSQAFSKQPISRQAQSYADSIKNPLGNFGDRSFVNSGNGLSRLSFR